MKKNIKTTKNNYSNWKYSITFIFCIVIFNIQAQDLNYIPETATVTGNEGGTNPVEYNGSGSYTAGSGITTGDNNLFLGYGTGAILNAGTLNVIIGNLAGSKLDGAADSDNVIIGQFAADLSIESSDNVLIGKYVARAIAGFDNVVIGAEAGMEMTTADFNVIIGEEAAQSLTEGDSNIIIGADAGFKLTEGDFNIFIGREAGSHATTSSGNTAIGGDTSNLTVNSLPPEYNFSHVTSASGYSLTTGVGNVFLGAGSGQDNEDGFANTYLGYGAGANSPHGDGNTFVGYASGAENNRNNAADKGNRNTYLGAMSGEANRTGSDNVGLGWSANFDDSTTKNNRNVFIGNNTIASGNNTVVIGYNATSTGDTNGNIALGSESSVSKNNAVAIGFNVDVTQANTMALGGETTSNRLSVGIGTVSANKNASLELADTDKGLLLNRVTTAERISMITAPASGVTLSITDEGLMVYDTDDKALYNWNGTEWIGVLSDNLGNHTATSSLDMVGNTIDNTTKINFQPNNGNGIRFWNNEAFQVSMGNSSDYQYGPVTDFSIKNTMNAASGRGWTWGGNGQTPVVGIDNTGKMQIANTLTIGNYTLPNTDGTENQVLSTDGAGLATWADVTDAQDLSLTGNILSLTNDATTVDLSPLTADLETRVTALEDALLASGTDMTPQQFNYQAVIRDANDVVLASTLVSFRISILKGSNMGIASYTEKHTITTSTNGLTNFSIGNGTIISGDFTTIDWGIDTYFLKVEADVTGGTNYIELGTSQLVSVPYALHAKSADNIIGFSAAGLRAELSSKDSKINKLEKELNELKKIVQQLINNESSKSSK